MCAADHRLEQPDGRRSGHGVGGADVVGGI